MDKNSRFCDLFTSEDVMLLADIGFIALSRGLVEHAREMFDGVHAVRSEHEAGLIGKAIVSITAGNSGEAISILQSLPVSDTVYTFLGIAFAEHGDFNQATECLNWVVRSYSDSTPHALLAAAVLELIEQSKDAKK